MFKFKTPRDNALFMTGMTFGVATGLVAIIVAFGSKTTDPILVPTALIIAATMALVTYINYRKFKELDK